MQHHFWSRGINFISLLFFFGCGQTATLEKEVPIWLKIHSEKGICSDGSPYSFFYKKGLPKKLLIYFQGGGAAWDYYNVATLPTFKPAVFESDDPGSWKGIFDFQNKVNPFTEYSFLVLPYCSADVFLGDMEKRYENGKHSKTIKHFGSRNSLDGIQWIIDRFSDLEQIVVAGSSAGAIATPIYGCVMADSYPNATISVICDSSGGYLSDSIPKVFDTWRTHEVIQKLLDLNDKPAEINVEKLALLAGKRNENIQFIVYNSLNDTSQRSFLELLGESGDRLNDNLYETANFLNQNLRYYHYYIDSSNYHTILDNDRFYKTKVSLETSFPQWVEKIIGRGQD
ncbi:pectinacetylesterase family protein [Flagellimonas meishanensis]|uniref:pectinacetylesterase family protein n=1 Tax=Flagellimonas meishanensis TaxID=2873264 RepID=UPI001CA74438|nr:pectinacetylesterase family protein [[Muricauda] meishanensis]